MGLFRACKLVRRHADQFEREMEETPKEPLGRAPPLSSLKGSLHTCQRDQRLPAPKLELRECGQGDGFGFPVPRSSETIERLAVERFGFYQVSAGFKSCSQIAKGLPLSACVGHPCESCRSAPHRLQGVLRSSSLDQRDTYGRS